MLATGVAAILLGLPMLWAAYGSGYDEAISPVAGLAISHGQVLYRDFWFLYGPGSAYFAAALLHLVGPSLVLFRATALVLVGAQAAVAYYLARRLASPLVAATLSVGAALTPYLVAAPDITAWSLGMLAATSGLALASSSESRAARLLGGAAIGLAFLCRPDLGAYAFLAAIVAWRDWRIVLGFAAPCAPAAVLLLVAVPFGEAIRSDRGLSPVHSGAISEPALPDAVGQRRLGPVAVAERISVRSALSSVLLIVGLWYLPLGAVAAGLYKVVRSHERTRATVALVFFALLCRLQGFQRPDAFHEAQALTPAWLLIVLWLPREWTPSWRGRGLLAAATFPIMLLVAGACLAIALPRAPYDAQLDQVAQFIRSRSTPSEPIFVGELDSRFSSVNPLSSTSLRIDLPP